MASYNYINNTGLQYFWVKIKEKFVMKDGDKVLSDNNLTDELLEKINNAGASDFSGEYADLTGKPQINGVELVGGNNTAASLGLATPNDVKAATNDMATKTWVNSQGFQTEEDINQAVSTATTDMATQSWVNGKGYQTAAQVQAAVSTATSGMATQSWVKGLGYATTSSVNSAIASAVSTVYKPKGSVAFASLPAVSSATAGDVYNVTNSFSTTVDFVEGTGKSYPAGTNVVCVDVSGTKKWDVLAGFVDLSSYTQDSDFVAITNGEIDDICV